MPQSAKQIKKAIKAISNIRKTTKTMQLISSSKMQKNLRILNGSKKYLEELDRISHKLHEGLVLEKENSLEERGKKELLICFGSDRGLAGSFNSKIIIKAKELIGENEVLGVQTDTIILGKKIRKIKAYTTGEMVSFYESSHNNLSTDAVAVLAKELSGFIKEKTYSKIRVVYTTYVSAFEQVAADFTLFPVKNENLQDDIAKNDFNPENSQAEYIFEPKKEVLIEYLTPIYIQGMLFKAWVESMVSENTARMQAMKNATDAAGDIIKRMTRELNKSRQAAITQEIAQIMGARQSMQN